MKPGGIKITQVSQPLLFGTPAQVAGGLGVKAKEVQVELMAKIRSPFEPVSTEPNGAYVFASSWYHDLLGAPGGFPRGYGV
jgi:hypothetical protein